MIEVEKEANRVPRALLIGEPGNDLQELINDYEDFMNNDDIGDMIRNRIIRKKA